MVYIENDYKNVYKGYKRGSAKIKCTGNEM